MKYVTRMTSLVSGLAVIVAAADLRAQDWPQWGGPNRDEKVSGLPRPRPGRSNFNKKWTVTVGKADGTPALVGGKLYVFSRQDANEVTQCLDAGHRKGNLER